MTRPGSFRTTSRWLALEAGDETLDLAASGTHAGAWEWDLLTDDQVWSEGLWALFGLAPSSGRPSFGAWLESIDPEERAAAERAMRDAVGRGGELSAAWRSQAPGGGARWLAIRGHALPEPDGRVRRYVGVALDVTDRERAERDRRSALKRFALEKEELAATLRSIGDAVIAADASGRVTIFNAVAEALTGWRAEEALGRPLVDVLRMVTEEGRRSVEHAVESVLQDGIVLQSVSPTLLVARDGTERPIAVNGAPRRDADGRVSGIVLVFRDDTAKRRAERAQRHSEERFRALIERSTDMLVVLDAEGRCRFWSQSAVEVLGWSPEERLGRRALRLVHDEDWSRMGELWRRLLARPGEVVRDTLRHRHKNGSWRLVEVTARNALGDPAVRGVVVNSRDLTDRRALEEQLEQAQRLESIGRLAGGVAHDFNNLLTVILSCADALRSDVEEGRPGSLEEIQEIREAGKRAADLTRQLLAFARRQVIKPVPLDLNATVTGSEGLLRRVLGEDVALSVRLEPGLWTARCDPRQIEQAILNLALNARDAMPRGGTLTLATENARVSPEDVVENPDRRPGDWVRLVVRDSGIGMSPEVRAHLFEPFFTTKSSGKGTGLGLSTVHGIVHQNGGHIHVASEEGRGTTIEVCFPRVLEAAVAVGAGAPAARRGGTETVLVVEDDPLVREVTVRTLRGAGYAVLVAGGGREALEVPARELERVRLLVTDVVMPGMNGRVLTDELGRRHPTLRVLYVSGHAEEVIANHGVLEPGIDLLSKPFTTASLLARVRAVLDGPGRERRPSAADGFQWTDELRTGIADLDEQHRDLISTMATLGEAAGEGDLSRAADVLAYLESYAATHFEAEERSMESSGYPGLAEHRSAHEAFVAELARRWARFEKAPGPSEAAELCDWQLTWLREHLLREDSAMARHVRGASKRP